MIFIDIKKELFTINGKNLLNVNLNLKKGDFLAIKGESGSGKTTFLRILAGLEKAKGVIKVENELWLKDNYFLPPQKRDIGFVFQDFALFNNMSVIENLLYVRNDKELANKLLKLSGIETLKNRNPLTLSGGQKQRVAIARALMRKPKILLLDEPFSALDEKMKEELQDMLYYFHKEFSLTSVMVSHSSSEIYKLSNKILILHYGEVKKFGNTRDIFNLKSKNFLVKGKILDIINLNTNYLAIVSLGQNISKFLVSKKENIKKGDEVIIEFNNFSTQLKVIK